MRFLLPIDAMNEARKGGLKGGGKARAATHCLPKRDKEKLLGRGATVPLGFTVGGKGVSRILQKEKKEHPIETTQVN